MGDHPERTDYLLLISGHSIINSILYRSFYYGCKGLIREGYAIKKSSGCPEAAQIACCAAIGQMYGCITTRIRPPSASELGGEDFQYQKDCFMCKDNVMKEANNNKTKWLHIRLSETEHTTMQKYFTRSACQKLSDYARKVLLNKPVIIRYRNQSADDFLSVQLQLKNELNAIGNNFNQLVRKLYTLRSHEEFQVWYITLELERKAFTKKVEDLMNLNQKIYGLWSQGSIPPATSQEL